MKKKQKQILEWVVAIAVGIVIGYVMIPWWKDRVEEPLPSINKIEVSENTVIPENEDIILDTDEVNKEEEEDVGGPDIVADYINYNNGFVLDIPEEWYVLEQSDKIRIGNKENDTEADYSSVDIFLRKKESTETSEEYYQRVYPGFEKQREAEDSGGHMGLEAHYYIDNSGYIAGEEIVVFSKEDTIFELHNNFASETNFDLVINSFQLI